MLVRTNMKPLTLRKKVMRRVKKAAVRRYENAKQNSAVISAALASRQNAGPLVPDDDLRFLLVPDAGQQQGYTIINHCRWDRLGDILPSLLFKKSFRSFVLANFAANSTAPIPILYRLA